MYTVDKQAIAGAFGRAAVRYQQHDTLQRQCGERLLRLAGRATPGRLLDAGCGPGGFSRHFSACGWQVTALDLSEAMLAQAQRQQAAWRYTCGDIEALPFETASFDLCWSNLAIQWCNSLRQAVSELQRVTRPGGQILFSTLADGSLAEMRQAWQALDVPAPVNALMPFADIQHQLSGLAVRWRREYLTLHFSGIYPALQSLKGIGATHLHRQSDRQPLTRNRLDLLQRHWPREAAGFTLSYEIIFGVMNGS
ncbi:malonyl-[acyl-carrier protein] O-methyltransferase BioC [Erwinia sp. OLTSP20]|uniref:malonyl-ACP O-methyltransferase BioC n=1 Tax=unclassified Erwinia TaxID=2622719 RepID=UPI000C181E8E|nr:MULTISPECIES: malonyl-ACP O-methyltransferase BioC [unclassified Erwinia]PIJ48724.1 malonyl-[acyl-carrier protein] O-methyltransferase BioC [Erwinia sp. OAMSP11]PIJ69349.1 malonyl-[acyl-carrier protein] O-methyltransferase BioC [Erwinia sp. OLSSP12]PIJ79183.1 malonyl-[acyl-carrier protein] O-methyltransferase BioC [Erwinia sp. OLCASP19]PIJ80709.1 malonyl-[acyl-carrier protein] O-methyltransferase BioC [Erwinia sp. OLMTSP26]PIJ82859.1 malonyl-[acyl-carrier protein] O-methyltransferase BioC [